VIILVLCVKLFSVSLPVLLCRVCSCFISVFSSVISVHSLSVCLLYFMLAALVANKRRPIHTSRRAVLLNAPHFDGQVITSAERSTDKAHGMGRN